MFVRIAVATCLLLGLIAGPAAADTGFTVEQRVPLAGGNTNDCTGEFFTITGYFFGGQYKWNAPCGGNDRCIRGKFVQYVEPSDAFFYDSTAPAMGAWILRLVR